MQPLNVFPFRSSFLRNSLRVLPCHGTTLTRSRSYPQYHKLIEQFLLKSVVRRFFCIRTKSFHRLDFTLREYIKRTCRQNFNVFHQSSSRKILTTHLPAGPFSDYFSQQSSDGVRQNAIQEESQAFRYLTKFVVKCNVINESLYQDIQSWQVSTESEHPPRRFGLHASLVYPGSLVRTSRISAAVTCDADDPCPEGMMFAFAVPESSKFWVDRADIRESNVSCRRDSCSAHTHVLYPKYTDRNTSRVSTDQRVSTFHIGSIFCFSPF